MREHPANCNVEFTKYKKIHLNFKKICTYEKKEVLLHQISKKRNHKPITKKLNKQIIMKTIFVVTYGKTPMRCFDTRMEAKAWIVKKILDGWTEKFFNYTPTLYIE